jgi:hypothetical protein
MGVPLAADVGETVPQVGEQAVPPCVRLHVTARLEVFVTVAVNCCTPPV